MITLSEEDFLELQENYGGICLACEARQYECEPYARKYTCEECGKSQVYGIEELLLMGEIEFN